MYKISNNSNSNNEYYNNHNNNLQYMQNKSLVDDISKMHILPPHCPMTPNSYTDFFNDNSKLYGVSPYHINVLNHKKDGRPKINLQYNNFYSDFKKDSLKYNSPVMADYDDMPNMSNMPNMPNMSNTIDTRLRASDITIYEATKNKKGFAVPIKSNGSNKLEHLYNDCLNKPTFEYKTFNSHNLQNRIDSKNNYNNWVDNPLFNVDISEETNTLYTNYMNNREQNASDIYSTVFEDMYILGYNPSSDEIKD